MTDASEDLSYRGFTLSVVQQSGEWLVTIWPTQVDQALPSSHDVPVVAASREKAFDLAKQEVDRLMRSEG